MKSCKGCVFAKWDTTASGRLHPSGDGRCTKTVKWPPIPACMYWIGGPPSPSGGWINRKRDNADHCPYYNRSP